MKAGDPRLRWRANALAWLCLAALAAGFWWWHIWHARPARADTFAWIDLYQYVLPAARFVSAELAEGRWPLWNPYQLAGMPIAALGMPGALYPGNLALLAWLPAERALEASTLLHWTLAGGFSWLFARRLGLDAPAALATALAVLFSGRMLSGAYQHFVLTTQAWLPAMLWAVHALIGERRVRFAAALGAILALSFLGGYVQTFVYAAQLAAAYGVFLVVVVCPPGERLRVVGLGALAGAIALALVLPQLLATLEFTALANRSLDGVSLAEAARRSVSPARLLSGLLGAFAPPRNDPQPYPWLVALPVLAAPLALLAPTRRATRAHAVFFVVAAVLAALFMLGTRTPVFPLYYQLPGGNLFRFPIRMDFVYVFAAVCAAGIGIQGVADALRKRRSDTVATGVAVLLAAAIGLEAIGRSGLDLAHPVISPPPRAIEPALAERVRKTGERMLLPMLPKTGTAEGVFAVSDYEPSLPRAYARYFAPGAPDLWHGQLDARRELASGALLPLLDRMSVRFYAAPAGMRRAALAAAADATPAPEQARFLERAAALPRTYVATGIRHHADPDTRRRLLYLGAPRDVVLEAPVAGLEAPGRGVATLAALSPQEVRIDARCESTCLVVLTDLDYPGWEATLDGRPVETRRTNLVYRGVVVPPGEHTLVHRYHPPALRRGLALGAGLLATVAVAVAVLLRRGLLRA